MQSIIKKQSDMNETDKESARKFFLGFPSGDGTQEEILNFHLRRFHQFQFTHSDIAELDGVEQTDIERGFIIASMQTNGDQVMVYGEPDESLFIDFMIKLLERDRLDLPGKIMTKGDKYLKFLRERKVKLNSDINGTQDKSWAGLYNDLRRYITDVSEKDFSYVVNNHKLPEGRVNKIKWTGDVSRLAYFGQEYFNSSWKQLNNCFDAGNSRGVKAGNVPEQVRKNNLGGKPDKKLRDFREILEKHKNQ